MNHADHLGLPSGAAGSIRRQTGEPTMITTDSINGVVRRGALGAVACSRARRRGRRDGARGIPVMPSVDPRFDWDGDPSGELPDAAAFVTPYAEEIRTTARRATEQMRSALIAREHELISRLHAEEVRVVTQYDVRLDPMPAALARFGHWVGLWRTSIDLCRSRAQAVVDQANQQLACYWDGVGRSHPRLRGKELPAPARWLPGRVELDESWHLPEVWLFADSRALRILEQQSSHRSGGRAA